MSTLKVYLAAPLRAAFRARDYAERLRMSESMSVCSTWHNDVPDGALDPLDESTRRDVLLTNLADLNRADCVLALMDWGVPRGSHNEIGYALALSKHVVWLVGANGEGMSIFTAHSLVTVVNEHRQVLPALYKVSHEIAEAPSATRLRQASYPAVEAFANASSKMKAGGR